MSTTTAIEIVTDLVSDIGIVLAAGLVVVFAFLGALIGLMYLYRVVRSKIGGPKR